MEYIFARRFSEISNTAALGTLTGGDLSMSSSWWGQRIGFCGSSVPKHPPKKTHHVQIWLYRNVLSLGKNKPLTRRLTCNHSLEVPADAQLLLLVTPQLQQDSGSRLTVAVPPLEDVRQSVGVVAQLEQDCQDNGIDASEVWLSNGEEQDGYFNKCMMLWLEWHKKKRWVTWKWSISYIHWAAPKEETLPLWPKSNFLSWSSRQCRTCGGKRNLARNQWRRSAWITSDQCFKKGKTRHLL